MNRCVRLLAAVTVAWICFRADGQRPPPRPTADPAIAEFRQKAEALEREVATLAPDQAAARWLALFDSETSLRDRLGYRELFTYADPLMASLPPPPAWPALVKAIDARPPGDALTRKREFALKSFGKLLTADSTWIHANAAQLEAELDNRGNMPALPLDRERTLVQVLLGEARPPIDEVDYFTQSIEFGRGMTLRVPDLVALVGEPKAEALLRKALANGVQIRVPYGAATRRLAQRLALEMVPQLADAQWMLVTPDSPELFEAMQKRFPAPPLVRPDNIGPADPIPGTEYDEAAQMHFLGLLQTGKTEQALAILKGIQGTRRPTVASLSPAAKKAIERVGRSPEVHQTVRKMLQDNPELNLWALYRDTAVHTDRIDEMVDQARQAIAKPDLPDATRRNIWTRLVDILLVADRADEAIPYMQTLIDDRGSRKEVHIAFSIQMAKIGRALNRPEWVQSGLAQAMTHLNSLPTARDSYDRTAWLLTAADTLMMSDRVEQALELLNKEMVRLTAGGVAGQNPATLMTVRRLAVVAANIAHKSGRHADVLAALERSAWWGASDLSEILTLREYYNTPMGLIAADALFNAGRTEEARRVLYALLDVLGSNDAAYALLIRMDGANALTKLDELQARDRFEDRPLVWRAVVLKDQGKLDEAERAVRQAIALDPSDGEQPRGDRMRAYAVLAEILAAKGNAKDAEFFSNVVKAIRLSEDADRLATLGLLKRSVKVYDESLKLFADAYCIQSRLAIKLMDLGLFKEAEEHYQRAFELMPDSFGRVESHCFGCEGIFEGTQAPQVADRVFTRLAQEHPNKPQVQYLLGHLREAQGRFSQALDAYRAAVRADPDYLNAWEKIQDLREYVQLSAQERDSAALAILRLDPLGLHARPALDSVHSLQKLWETAAALAKYRRADRGPLLRLPASAAAQTGQASSTFGVNAEGSPPLPAKAVASTEAVRLVRRAMLQP